MPQAPMTRPKGASGVQTAAPPETSTTVHPLPRRRAEDDPAASAAPSARPPSAPHAPPPMSAPPPAHPPTAPRNASADVSCIAPPAPAHALAPPRRAPRRTPPPAPAYPAPLDARYAPHAAAHYRAAHGLPAHAPHVPHAHQDGAHAVHGHHGAALHGHAAHAYAWHAPPPHCAAPGAVGHRAYAYPVHPQLIPVLPHGVLAPYGHVQPSIWAPSHPHVSGHAHEHGHPQVSRQAHPQTHIPSTLGSYPAPVPVQGMGQAHYTHYYSPHHAMPPPGQPQVMHPVQVAPSEVPVPHTHMHHAVTAPHAPRAHSEAPPRPSPSPPPLHTGLKREPVPLSKGGDLAKPRESQAKLDTNVSLREVVASSATLSTVKKPPDPPDSQKEGDDAGEKDASEKPNRPRGQAGSSKRPREKQGTQPVRKSRKPYTITKNRESWSKQEHLLFLEALRLFNRDWKRIQAHVGTKTVLQIRSHAQKHFCKVAKYNTGEYIPPARPKRRASQPYPRSRNTSNAKTSATETGTADDKQDENMTNTNTVTTGSGTGSDNGAGSSDNGNVSGNGLDSGTGEANTAPEGTPEGPPSRQRSVDRCSDSLPVSGREQKPVTENEANQSSLRTIPKAEMDGGNGQTACSRPVSCSRRTTLAIPGSYEHYYFNVVRPNGLPYGTGFYQGNHYPAQHPAYAWHDQVCRQPDTCTAHRRPYANSNGARPSSSAHPVSNLASHVPCSDAAMTPQPISSQSIMHGITGMRQVPPPAETPLIVLSNCVDMVAHQGGQKPAPGWATAAAARRAHRARVIRERKRSLMQNEGHAVEKSKTKDVARTAEAAEPTVLGQQQKCNGPAAGEKAQAGLGQEAQTADVLIPPSDVGVVDVGSDEAVAGFSGSDRQESDGAAGGSTGRTTPETSEEDPNSSNDGSGDDGRRNTRGSSPADPNSSGSREDSPSAPDTNPDSGLSSATGTPPESRGPSPPSGGKNGAQKDREAGSRGSGAKQAPTARAGDTVMGVAEVLSDYTASNGNEAPAENGRGFSATTRKETTSAPKNPKTAIDSLLNEAPRHSYPSAFTGSTPGSEQKRGRQSQDEACKQEREASGQAYEGVQEPDLQRRKHDFTQGVINK